MKNERIYIWDPVLHYVSFFIAFFFVFALLWHSVLPVSAKTVNSIPSYSVDDYPYQLFLEDSSGTNKIYIFSAYRPFVSKFGSGSVYSLGYDVGDYWMYFSTNSGSSYGEYHTVVSDQNKAIANVSNQYSIISSTSDIYYDNGAIFFQLPRPLVAAVQGASPAEALKEVILLIPLSILFLAGCLGLRKGLRLLLTLLHRA